MFNSSANLAPSPAILPREKVTDIPEEERVKLNDQDAWRATSTQARLWFLESRGSYSYCNGRSLRLHGELNIAALDAALKQIVLRHEALRTTFQEVNGILYQVIGSGEQFALEVVVQDIGNQRKAVQCQLREQAYRPFDLTQDCLLRAVLFRLGETEFSLLMVIHQIASDDESFRVLLKDLSRLYRSYLEPVSSLPLPLQFADYSLWHHQLQRSNREANQHYWQQQLSSNLQVDLPLDKPRGTEQTYSGKQVALQLETPLVTELKALGNQVGASLFMVLLASLDVLLHRYSQQSDIVIGSPVTNRARPELEGVIGCFTDNIPLKTDLSGNPPFWELLKQVRQTVLDVYDHAYSFAGIEAHQGTNHPSVMLSLQSPEAELDLPHISARCTAELNLQLNRQAPRDLTIVLKEKQGIEGVIEYNHDLFNDDTIERLVGHWQTLLRGILAAPHSSIGQLPLITEAEQHQLLVQWNTTATDGGSDSCLHDLFEEQVQRTPDAVAVVYQEQRLTYRELNERANRLAHYLQTLGVGPEVLVGICVERSIEMIVGLLGILKAGGAYVPLDPDYPAERLSFVLEDTQVPVLLTQQCLAEKLPASNAQVVYLDTDWNEALSDQNPLSNAAPNNLAYVIYTSGSTGQPKGVLISHRNVVRLFRATSWFSFDEGDVWTLFHSYAFDFSVWEIWGALLHGGRLVVVPFWITRSPQSFYQLLCSERVTVLNQTPSAFRQLIQAEEAAAAPQELALRLIIFGGEALNLGDLKPWFQRHGDRLQLVNMYGITETTVHVTYYPIRAADVEVSNSPIGRSIPDLQLYLLDCHLNLLPIGVPGEIYVGGAGLARGYHNRPELTATKFIPHPFSDDRDARLYKAGDLARYRADGTLEFLGRLDNQVKIRGFRVELGEIEAALVQHPQVQAAVAIARQDESSSHSLVAYLVTKMSLRVRELRSFLQEKLPSHMVPTAFVFLETLPLTHNGKIDRRALPDPTLSQLGTEFVAPRTPIEAQVSQIWSKLLKREPIGANDNFFELGGHSLLATQVLSRIREDFSIELPLRTLFEAPTVAELAASMEQHQASVTQLPAIAPVSRQERQAASLSSNVVSPASFSQQRLWLFDQIEGKSAIYNIPLTLLLKGTLNIAILERSLSEIVARHETLRTNFRKLDDALVVIAEATDFHLQVLDLPLPGDPRPLPPELKKLISQEALHPFDLALDPLFRVKLLRLNTEHHILLVTMHHIISDAWSVGVFMQELSGLYRAFSTGKPSPLAPLPIQYADFAHWQQEWLLGENLNCHLSYWRQQLADIPPLLELPTDRPRPPKQSFRGARERFQLPPALTQQLKELSQRTQTTLFMTLLAAFTVLLSRYSGFKDIVVGSPIANRQRSELEPLIGCFINTLVLRTKLTQSTFVEVLKQVRQTALDAYAHQVPFEKLVEIQQERSLSHHPLFQVMFILQNAPRDDQKLPGLEITPIELDPPGAKFDLTLEMREAPADSLLSDQGVGTTQPTVLSGWFEYNSDLFEADTIARMVGHFQTLLAGVVEAPEQPISALPLLSHQERHQIVVDWNHTNEDFQEQCIHDLVAAQAARTPDAVAVVLESGFEVQGTSLNTARQLTYRELDERANQLASYLRSQGLAPGDLVGICLERSLEMMVALLGVLKAGGAYVPLDPTYPTERLALMMSDAQIAFLLTQQHLSLPLSEHQAQVVYLDDWQTIARTVSTQSQRKVTPADLAYVIYTSGSTGTPKGVQIRHRSVTNFLRSMARRPGLTAQDRLLSVTTLSFDIAVLELFLPLSVGAQVILVSSEVASDGTRLCSVLERAGATVMQATPATWQMLLASGWQGNPGLKMLCGGEALSEELAHQLLKRGASLWNLYGPTEATVWSTVSQVESPEAPISIGTPIGNTQIYLLDPDFNPVPVGVPGELHIGGQGLAQGYLNRPELTNQKFISNPFSEAPSRLYRTGDLARYRSDGSIDYLGRIDRQVKLRGFRIELGEIESVLDQHPTIQQSLVTVREDRPGEQLLVAYAVAESAVAPQQLSQFVGHKLPHYMVPSAFVVLDQFPLTPNGKIDRRALPAPDWMQVNVTSRVLPRTPIEQQIADIWTKILGLESVGVDDSFFALGGHSLLAAQVVSRLRSHFAVEVSLRTLFEAKTIAALAETIEKLRADSAPQAIAPITRSSRRR